MGERGTTAVGLLGGEKKSSEQKSSVACGGKKIRVAGVMCTVLLLPRGLLSMTERE